MRVLAVDTSTERESAAVVADGAVWGEVRLTATDAHSRQLLPAIDFLLRGLRIAPRDIEAYAVTTGPGSFTGLRVGLSTVQGLALGAGRLCLGLPALDVLAARISGAADRLAAVMEAYRGEVYAAAYDREARPLLPPVVEPLESFLERLPASIAVIGDAALKYRDRILARRAAAVFPDRSLFLAATLGRLAEPRLAAGEGVPPEELRPLYLRGADIRPSQP